MTLPNHHHTVQISWNFGLFHCILRKNYKLSSVHTFSPIWGFSWTNIRITDFYKICGPAKLWGRCRMFVYKIFMDDFNCFFFLFRNFGRITEVDRWQKKRLTYIFIRKNACPSDVREITRKDIIDDISSIWLNIFFPRVTLTYLLKSIFTDTKKKNRKLFPSKSRRNGRHWIDILVTFFTLSSQSSRLAFPLGDFLCLALFLTSKFSSAILFR